MHLFYKFNQIKYTHGHISDFVTEAAFNQASEKAKEFLDQQTDEKLRKNVTNAKKSHVYPEVICAWAILTSKTTKEAIEKIEKEMQDFERAYKDSYKKTSGVKKE